MAVSYKAQVDEALCLNGNEGQLMVLQISAHLSPHFPDKWFVVLFLCTKRVADITTCRIIARQTVLLFLTSRGCDNLLCVSTVNYHYQDSFPIYGVYDKWGLYHSRSWLHTDTVIKILEETWQPSMFLTNSFMFGRKTSRKQQLINTIKMYTIF